MFKIWTILGISKIEIFNFYGKGNVKTWFLDFNVATK